MPRSSWRSCRASTTTSARRAALAARYDRALAAIDGLSRPQTLPGVRHAYHLVHGLVRSRAPRRASSPALQRRGIGTVVNYRAIHLLTYFRELLGHARGDFPVAERIGDSTFSLPFYPAMPHEHADQVANALRAASRAT